jgi:hypothetical protein
VFVASSPGFPIYNSVGFGAAVPLNGGYAQPPYPANPMAQPIVPGGNGTFPYDGGPVNPVPLPRVDPNMAPPNPSPIVTDLPVSGKTKVITPVASPYKYKAYGEK